MARRVSVPTADDLFRPTIEADPSLGAAAGRPQSSVRAVPDVQPAPSDRPDQDGEGDGGDGGDGVSAEAAGKRASGRVRHDEKMTVYVTSEELLDIERTRLELRGVHGLAVDRGRLVREAIDAVLADFHSEGETSMLVRRLREG